MREIARIRLFCEELTGLWEKCPDMRFGQLIVNSLGIDPFYVEDGLKTKVGYAPEMESFVEMCFDPKSPMNARLKQTLLQMLKEEDGNK